MCECFFVVAKKLSNARIRSVRAILYSDRAKNMPSDAFASKTVILSTKDFVRCTIDPKHQAKPDFYSSSATVANDDAKLENFFATAPLRRVTDGIPHLSEIYPKYDFEANLWQKGANSVQRRSVPPESSLRIRKAGLQVVKTRSIFSSARTVTVACSPLRVNAFREYARFEALKRKLTNVRSIRPANPFVRRLIRMLPPEAPIPAGIFSAFLT